MLGKRPRLVLRTSSKLNLPDFNEENGYGYGADCSSSNHSSSKLQQASVSCNSRITPSSTVGAPRHNVVIGFDLAGEKKPGDACESPRSVLESNALCGVHKVSSQEKQARSPRSALESLLFSPRAPWVKNTGSQGVGLAIVAAIKAEEEEDSAKVHLLQQIAPAGKCCTAAKAQQLPPLKSQPIPIAHPSPRQWKQESINVDDEGYHGDGAVLFDHYEEETDEEQADCALPWSNCFRRACPPSLKPHQSGDIKVEARPSIFSTASPVSSCCSEAANLLTADFLQHCYLCKRTLAQGKDVYMYRGDRAFCSPECRYQQILLDERKEKYSAAVSCHAGGVSTYQRVVAGATAAAA